MLKPNLQTVMWVSVGAALCGGPYVWYTVWAAADVSGGDCVNTEICVLCTVFSKVLQTVNSRQQAARGCRQEGSADRKQEAASSKVLQTGSRR